jgi:hypothetical protein
MQVFLKISTDAEVVPSSNEMHGNAAGEGSSLDAEAESEEQNLIGDFGPIEKKASSDLLAMCKLRVLRLLRSPSAFFFMIFMPIVLVAAGLAIVKSQSGGYQKQVINFTSPTGT